MSTDTTTVPRVPRGLAGVEVTDTEIGDVRGAEGFYHYRQYSALDLAASRPFEDVWHLLTEGALPDAAASAAHRDAVAAARADAADVIAVLPTLAADPDRPLATLRTAWSWLGAHLGLQPVYDLEEQARQRDALRLAALAPTVLAAAHRIGRGEAPLAADPALGHAADYLRMLTGHDPSDEDVAAIQTYLVLTLDHGFNASTFTARTVASTGADVAAALVAGIGSFSGPLHGGAPDRALAALDAIGEPANTRAFVQAELGSGRRIMGFGHAVYRTHDPRARHLRELALARGGALAEFAAQVEDEVERVLHELKPDRPLHANVEFWAGVVMEQAGIPRSMFTPTFCVARAVGWAANVLEQARDPKIIRPAARYVGPPAPQPVPSA